MRRIIIILSLVFSASLQAQIVRTYPVYTFPGEPDPYCPEYRAVYNALDIKPGSSGADTADIQNDLAYSLDSIGYFDRIKLLYVCVQRSTAGAKINWAKPGTYNLTDPGSTKPLFVKYQGFDPDGKTDYLATGWIGATDSLLDNHAEGIGRLDLSLGAWVLGNTTAAATPFGTVNVSGTTRNFMALNYGDKVVAYICSNTSYSIGDPVTAIGWTLSTRRGYSAQETYKDNTSLGEGAVVRTVLPDVQTYVLARNNNGTEDYFFDPIVSIVLIMDQVDDTEELNLYNIFHRFMTRMGL